MPSGSSILSHETAITCRNLSKSFVLYPSPRAMTADRLGLYRLFGRMRPPFPEHRALSGIDLDIRKGENVALLGRNGAGKSTLLKLLTGLLKPTTGEAHVNGRIQALFDLGLGFHPEFSGRDNIVAALAYNGLSRDQEAAATEDIIEFCQLNEYLDQPVSTYSAGMRARLFFAVATAIIPDVLIVDEVLSVGDAYFSARSVERVRKLTASGCTLLLVSHSMAQVLQFCDRAIWIDNGQVRADGAALEVVKEYEAYIQRLRKGDTTALSALPDERSAWVKERLVAKASGPGLSIATGGVSRWASYGALTISEVHAVPDEGQTPKTGDGLSLRIDTVSDTDFDQDVIFSFFVFRDDGALVSRFISEPHRVNLKAGEKATGELRLEKLLLGQGRYILSASIHRTGNGEESVGEAFDLLSRSFELEVAPAIPTDPDFQFLHPEKWTIKP